MLLWQRRSDDDDHDDSILLLVLLLSLLCGNVTSLSSEAVNPCVLQQPDRWRTKQKRMTNKDQQRRFTFVIVCKHCNVSRNSLGDMKTHLDFCCCRCPSPPPPPPPPHHHHPHPHPPPTTHHHHHRNDGDDDDDDDDDDGQILVALSKQQH